MLQSKDSNIGRELRLLKRELEERGINLNSELFRKSHLEDDTLLELGKGQVKQQTFASDALEKGY